ncbi:MAG: hypothetical protein ACK54R_03675, partial [Pirellulaceae bacterium]
GKDVVRSGLISFGTVGATGPQAIAAPAAEEFNMLRHHFGSYHKTETNSEALRAAKSLLP